MITGQYTRIRTADMDDAETLADLYKPDFPRSFLLDLRRELQILAPDSIRELLTHKEIKSGVLYTVEDKGGRIRGICSLKPAVPALFYAEILVAFLDLQDYETPIGEEAMEFLKKRAFVEQKLNKILAQCLENETAYRHLLIQQGFESDGIQRDVLFSQGRYYNLETLACVRKGWLHSEGNEPCQ